MLHAVYQPFALKVIFKIIVFWNSINLWISFMCLVFKKWTLHLVNLETWNLVKIGNFKNLIFCKFLSVDLARSVFSSVQYRGSLHG